MSKILDLKDNKIIISSEALGISFFKELWDNDKSKDKVIALDNFKYLYYFADFDSPYFKYLEEDRHNQIIKYCISNKEFKVTNELNLAIKEYKKLNITPSMEMLEAATSTIHKMKDYFKTVDFTKLNDDGDEKYNIEKIQNAIIKMPKLMEALNQAKEICLKEQTSSTKVRGNAVVGKYED